MEAQRAFFNGVADVWDEICHHDRGKIQYILDLLDIQPGEAVLDVGSGTGVLIEHLYDKVTAKGHIKGVDLADGMIEKAKAKYPYDNVDFQWGDALSMDGDEGVYDHIICYSMFPHFQSRQKEAIEKLAGKLKEGGKLMVCHAQSRAAINRLHQRIEGAVQGDHLPAMDAMGGYFIHAHLKLLMTIDNEEMFVIIGNKPSMDP